MDDQISLDHGEGGRLTHDLINNLFAKSFGIAKPLTDSAILFNSANILAFTTDSYVIDPIFFPGGNIGKLAICGTVNDLAVSGAIPKFISASFIIEEGLSFHDLEKIVSSMASEANLAGVRIVAGDTKVVDRGKCDKLFITTSGVGFVDPRYIHISGGQNVIPNDVLIVNGSLANHAIATLGARKQLSFTTPIQSDCASLNLIIKELLDNNIDIKFMRDLTRGGLATVLNELAEITKLKVSINEDAIPVEEPVRGLCEILGFDPLYLANEGKMLMIVSEADMLRALKILRANPLGVNSQIIGKIEDNSECRVVLNTLTGGKRFLDVSTGVQLPRIC